MVDVDKAVIARYKKDGKDFEILVDCDKALELRRGKSVSIGDVMAVSDIFKDVKKGEKASMNEIKSIFGTDDAFEVGKLIITKGEVQLTAKHIAAEREEKRKKIIAIIHRNAVDPKTGMPHPPQRIENAMNEAKVRIDEHKSAEDQVETILSSLRSIIPIKFETKEIQVRIPAKFAAQSYHILKKHNLKKDEWQNDGSLMAVLDIPAGIVDEFYSEINKLCHGEVESKVIGAK